MISVNEAANDIPEPDERKMNSIIADKLESSIDSIIRKCKYRLTEKGEKEEYFIKGGLTDEEILYIEKNHNSKDMIFDELVSGYLDGKWELDISTNDKYRRSCISNLLNFSCASVHGLINSYPFEDTIREENFPICISIQLLPIDDHK